MFRFQRLWKSGYILNSGAGGSGFNFQQQLLSQSSMRHRNTTKTFLHTNVVTRKVQKQQCRIILLETIAASNERVRPSYMNLYCYPISPAILFRKEKNQLKLPNADGVSPANSWRTYLSSILTNSMEPATDATSECTPLDHFCNTSAGLTRGTRS